MDNELEKAIKNYKKYRTDNYLIPVIIALKNNDVYVTVDTECELLANDINSELKRNVNIYPTIVTSGKNDYWYTIFSSERKIPSNFKEKYLVVNAKLRDFVDDCLKDKYIKGIAINHSSDDHIHIEKFLLKGLKQFL